MKPNIFLKNMSGVYGIRNLTNNKIYVGQTRCMYKRCHQYVYDFESGRSGRLNDYLRRAMEKTGLSNFELFPLEFCNIQSLIERELIWIRRLKSNVRTYGYNLRLDLPRYGLIVDQETSDKISQNLKAQWASGSRDGHSDKMKTSWLNNPERREQQSEVLRNNLTKFEYVLEKDGEVNVALYADLRDLGLQNVLATMKRKQSDTVDFKGYRITRRGKGES